MQARPAPRPSESTPRLENVLATVFLDSIDDMSRPSFSVSFGQSRDLPRLGLVIHGIPHLIANAHEFGGEPHLLCARVRQFDGNDLVDPARARRHHDDSVGEGNGLFSVVSYEHNGA